MARLVLLLRAGVLVTLTLVGLALTWALVLPVLGAAVDDASRGDRLAPAVITAAGAAGVLAVATWFALSLLRYTSSVLDAAPPSGPRPAAPVVVRLVTFALGTAVGAALAAPATAVPRDRPAAGEGVTHTLAPALLGLRLPDRTSGASPAVVIVHEGDSLWSIATRLLGPQAGAAQVAEAVGRLHGANRHRIGPDPDLIHPGLRLDLPARLAPSAPHAPLGERS